MNRKYIYIIMTVLVLFGVAFGTWWFIQMRPAFPYLRLLSSGDRVKIREATGLLRGVVSATNERGDSVVRNIPGHKPLKGYAARAVKRKVLEMLATSDDANELFCLLITGDEFSWQFNTTGFAFTGADLTTAVMSNAIDKVNAYLDETIKSKHNLRFKFKIKDVNGTLVLNPFGAALEND